jgi:uncharacterized BrkB/YihY/UPF0761 family membrane protein
MFIIPYIFVIVAVFDVAGTVAGEDPQKVAKTAGIGGLLAQAVHGSAQHLTGANRFFALAAGLVAVFLAARAFLKTLRIVHGLVWRVRVHKQARPGRAVAVVIVLVTLALLLSTAIEHLRNASGLGGLAAILLFTVLPAGIWLALEFAMPHVPQAGWKDLVPGAILFGVAVLALHVFTVYWVAHLIRRRSATYGALGVALALLLWAYVFGRIMTASAVLNATMWSRAHPRPGAQEPDAVTTAGTPGAPIEADEVIERLSGPDIAR